MTDTPGGARDARGRTHGLVFRDPGAYAAHPHMAVAADGTFLLVFNLAPRRRVVLHPPLDPAFRNVVMRSSDEGRSWSVPKPVPAGEATGFECAGLTALPDGSVLLNQWRFGWGPTERFPPGAEDLALPSDLAAQWARSTEFEGLHGVAGPAAVLDLFPLARCGGETLASLAETPSSPFRPAGRIDTAPYSGGYGMRGGIVMPGGEIVLPLSDVPHYREVFLVRSRDGGRTWDRPEPVAAVPGRSFEEPAPVLLAGGDLLLVLRENETRILHTVRSADGGRTWSRPQPTGISDYPAHVLRLRDGRLAMVAGRRRPPFGIVLYFAGADGEDWSGPVVLRDDLPDRDLGYPTAAERGNGELLVVYYGRDRSGTTAIQSTVAGAELLGGARNHVPG